MLFRKFNLLLMTICDLCEKHVRTTTHQSLWLTNFAKDYLKKLSLDQLDTLYKIADEGMMVCKDCKRLCELGDRDCTIVNLANRNAYGNRITADDRVKKAIEAEYMIRINRQKVLKAVKR